MSALERLASHAAAGVRGAVSGALRQAVALHVADTVGAWVAAARTPEGRALLQLESADPKHAALKPGGVPDRVRRNCALARLSEIDDIHLASCTTPGAVIVPAVLTLSASMDPCDGAAVTEAIVAGYEAMVRLGKALDGPSILYRGIWPTYIAAPFGVAAACARLLGLSEREAAHALALALALAAPGVGHQSGGARWLALGQAARNGIVAATSAAAGFTADLGMLEGEFFPSVYQVSPDPGALTEGLGERRAIAEVSFKPWCAARQTMAAAQGLKELIEGGLAPAEIGAIEVRIPPPYFKMVNHGVVPGDRISHLTSLPYQLASAALAPQNMFDVGRAPAGLSGEVQSFMNKVTVRADESLLGYFPKAWPAKIAVGTPSAHHERLVIHVPGDPERPFDERGVSDKFRRVVAPLLGESAADDLLHSSLAAVAGNGAAASLHERIERLCRDALTRS